MIEITKLDDLLEWFYNCIAPFNQTNKEEELDQIKKEFYDLSPNEEINQGVMTQMLFAS